VLDRDAAFAIVAALTLTLKDVFRFAERLTLASDHGALGEQTLEMLDCRSFEVRHLYKDAIYDFLLTFLAREWVGTFRFPHEHIASVLLHLYNQRLDEWKSTPSPKACR
jgi:hypothetical protein